MRPFNIAKDRGLRWLLRTGRNEYYIPHPTTVASDVKLLFGAAKEKFALELQVRHIIYNVNYNLHGIPEYGWLPSVCDRLLDSAKSSSMDEYCGDLSSEWRTRNGAARFC